MTFEPPTRFRILDRLGKGGFGEVYAAHDDVRDMVVALKRLSRRTPDALARFKNEFRALQAVRHERLVALHELFEHEGEWFFTMELVRGVDFFRATRRLSFEGTPSDATLDMEVDDAAADAGKLRAAIAQLVEGTAALHAAGHLHRDLKPSNVIVDAHGALKILDFGLVLDLDRGGAGHSFSLVGTPAYASPEQLTGQELDTASDWYSVGAMIYEALAGRAPFADVASGALLITKMTTSAPPLPPQPDGLDDLAALARELLGADPAKRPRVDEIVRRLRAGETAGAAAVDALVWAVPPRTAGGSLERQPATRALSFATPPVVVAARVVDATHTRAEVFIGRERELTALLELQRATSTGCAIACLLGPSGMGKSSLLRAFEARVRADDPSALVLHGCCYERESVPFKAVDGIVEELARALRRMGEAECRELLPNGLPALLELFPTLGTVSAIRATRRRGAPPRDPNERRVEGMRALRELLERAALRRPVVLIIDDAQWGDADSAILVEEILSRPAPPLLIVVGARERQGPFLEPIAALQAALQMETGRAATIELGPLDTDDATALAVAVGADDARAVLVAQEAGGHPLFIEELARRSGATVDLGSAIRARVAGMPDVARRALAMVVVAGAPLPVDVIVEAVNDRAKAFAALELLRAANLVRTVEGDGAGAVTAYHDRVRETVVADLDESARADLHRPLAAAFLLHHPDDHETIAFHLEAARDPRAAAALVKAADRALSQLAFERAADAYARALAFAATTDAPAPASLWTSHANALERAGRGTEAAAAFLRAAALAAPDDALDLRRRSAQASLQAGAVDEGFRAMADVVAAAHLAWPKSRGAAVRAAVVEIVRSRLFGFRPVAADARAPPDVEARMRVLWSATLGFGAIEPQMSFFFSAQLGSLLRAHPDLRYDLCRRFLFLYAEASQGRRAQAQKLIAELEANFVHLDDDDVALFRIQMGAAPFLYGDLVATEQKLTPIVQHLTQAEPSWSWESTVGRAALLWTRFYLGDLATLRDTVPQQAREAHRRGNRFAAISFSAHFAVVAWLAADEPAAGREAVTAAATLWKARTFDVQSSWLLVAEAALALYTGAPADGLRHLRERWPALVASGLLGFYPIVTLQLHGLRAGCALDAVDASDAREGTAAIAEAVRCLRVLRKNPLPFAPAFALQLQAAIAARKGERNAADLLDRSVAGFTAAGMRAYAAATRVRAAELRGDVAEAREALAALAQLGAANPRRMLRLLAPGFFALDAGASASDG